MIPKVLKVIDSHFQNRFLRKYFEWAFDISMKMLEFFANNFNF